LPVRDEVVDRAGIGGEIARAIDVGEIDPAAEGQRDTLVADLAGRTEIGWRGLVGRLRKGAVRLRGFPGLRVDPLLRSRLVIHALLEQLEFCLELLDLRGRVVLCKSLARGGNDATGNNPSE